MTEDLKEEPLEENPVKVFIRDIAKFTQDEENKYHYYFCGMKFKSIQVHGVVTEVYSQGADMISFQLSDPTGSVDVYYNTSNFLTLPKDTMAKLNEQLQAVKARSSSPQFHSFLTLKWMKDEIKKAHNDLIFEEGDCVSVLGDLFVDNTEVRKISTCVCFKTSLTMDVIWLVELLDLYKHIYFSKKEAESVTVDDAVGECDEIILQKDGVK